MMNTRGSDASGAATITINGRELKLRRHETDFSVMAPAAGLTNRGISEKVLLGPALTRARTADASQRDEVMDQVRGRAVDRRVRVEVQRVAVRSAHAQTRLSSRSRLRRRSA